MTGEHKVHEDEPAVIAVTDEADGIASTAPVPTSVTEA
jgi:hypothetical protein